MEKSDINGNLNKESESSNDDSQTSLLDTNQKGSNLTQEQLERINVNKKRALEIRQSKERKSKIAKTVLNTLEPKKLLDTGGGFYLDEEDLIEEEKNEEIIVESPPVPLPNQHLLCMKCRKRFPHSFLSINFNYNICDSCKTEYSEDYKLITRTDAKSEFLLKDFDLDDPDQEPVLKFIVRKNPHNKRWGDMKLYLRCQIQEKALAVHETLEKLEEKRLEKVSNLQKSRQNTYEKKLKDLRKEARQGSKKLSAFHVHEYEEEKYDEEKEIYYKTCKTCDYKQEYEEL